MYQFTMVGIYASSNFMKLILVAVSKEHGAAALFVNVLFILRDTSTNI